MPFDYKKEYKEFYQPSKKPGIVEIPAMQYIAVRGKGNPNEAEGEYQSAIGMLYAIAFILKMSDKGTHQIEGYFPYVVPPLEGLWWQSSDRIDYSHKEHFEWISMIRLPDFIEKKDFEWAITEAAKKKKADFSKVEFFTYEEGLCVQCTHIGSYDNEPTTITALDTYAAENGYQVDFASGRHHHEIYLSDPRKCAPETCKTVIRHPIKKPTTLNLSNISNPPSLPDLWHVCNRLVRPPVFRCIPEFSRFLLKRFLHIPPIDTDSILNIIWGGNLRSSRVSRLDLGVP